MASFVPAVIGRLGAEHSKKPCHRWVGHVALSGLLFTVKSDDQGVKSTNYSWTI
jgi:hypothetical protein